MCGISGFFSVNAPSKGAREFVTQMNDFQKRRGPDDEGIWENEHVCFGHRRLSIIDLSPRGHQPMTRGNLAITYNGEVYNFQSLKKELEDLGENFQSDSDTEVVLAAYQKWGTDCFARLRGMFAFALWDGEKEELYLVRDKFGIKPLYYGQTARGIVFASTVGAILKSGAISPDKDTDSRALFLIFGSIPLPFTTHKHIKSVPDGSYVKASKNENKIVRYYSSVDAFSGKSIPFSSARACEVFKNSVSSHLVSDAPLGVFLSGGLDSSAIAAFAAKARNKPVTTLSVSFDEAEFSEKEYQDAVAKKIKSEHKDILLRKEDFQNSLEDALQAMDQPSIDGINTYFISKAAREAGLKVVLSGLGGDEIFLGYRNFRRAAFVARFAKPLALIPFLSGKYERFSYLRFSPILGYYLVFRGIFPPGKVMEMTGMKRDELKGLLSRLEERIFGDEREKILRMRPVQRLSYLETKLYMQNQLLKDSDFMAMRHSVEIRVPFIDHELVEYMARISPKEKLRGPHNKELLVQIARNEIPTSVYEREKMGFTLPFEKWMSESGAVSGGAHWSKEWCGQVFEKWNNTHRS